MEIKASVRISPNGYGFGYDWTLVIEKDGLPRTFWLGQAEKFCQRILGMSVMELLKHHNIPLITGAQNSNEGVNSELAWIIIDWLTPDGRDSEETAQYVHETLQSWELSCE